jgi:hypothetical protein
MINMIAPSNGIAKTYSNAKSGNIYTPTAGGLISNVANGDVGALINEGCTLVPNGGTTPWVPGRFYGLPKGATPLAVLTVTATLYAYPVVVPNLSTLSTLNLSVTTGETGGAAHIGLYEDNGAGYPGALVVDSGALTGLTGTAIATYTVSPAGSILLPPGLYWGASIFSASSTFISVAGIDPIYSTAVNADLGSDTAAHALATASEVSTGISVAGTYGALPATFTSGGSLIQNAACPLIAIGV